MSNAKQVYVLQKGNHKVVVGETKPYYDRARKAWVTDKGMFPTVNPADYMVALYVAPPQG